MKKLIMTAFLLLVATVMLTSSTYAWFAMSTKVTAIGMQITAQSNETYLLIGTGDNDTAAEIQAAATTEVDFAMTDAESEVYPSAPVLTSAEAAYLTTASKTIEGNAITTPGALITTQATAAAVTNWYTANAESPDAATMKTGSAVQLTAFTDYVIKKTVYLTVAVGSNPAASLTVTPTFTQKAGGSDITAAKILLATEDNVIAVLTSADNGTAVSIQGASNIVDDDVLVIDLYIYYDGNESVVYTNNKANLAGAEIELEFSVEAVTA